MKTNRLLTIALLSAISIIFTRFLSVMIPLFGFNAIRISLGDIPIMLAGILLGPLAGALVGGISDIIGSVFLSPYGYFPGFTLSAIFVGIIPGLFSKYIEKNGMKFITMIIISLATQIPVSIFLNTIWLTMLYGTTFTVLVIPRIISNSIMLPIYTIIIYLLYIKLNNVSIVKKQTTL